jgi:hypothetical protein
VVLLIFLPFLLTLLIAGFLHGDSRDHFLGAMTFWMGVSYPAVLAAVIYWVWRRRRANSTPTGAATVGDTQAGGQGAVASARKRFPRFILFTTVAAAGLFIFLLLDTNYNVQRPTATEIRAIISQNAPGSLRVSILEGHMHSLFHEYPEMYRTLWVVVRKDGKVTKYSSDVDDATLAVIKEKGVACPTYVSGRDFEVLGAPGRLSVFLIAFIVAIGGVFWLMRRAAAKRQARLNPN